MRQPAINLLGAAAAVLPPPVDPELPNLGTQFGITGAEFGQSLQGQPVHIFGSAEYDITSHNNSGGFSGFDPIGETLEVYKALSGSQGNWYGLNTATKTLVPLGSEASPMKREESGNNVNQNVVWAFDGLFRLTDDKLQRWTVGGSSPEDSVDLPSVLAHHSGEDAQHLEFRLQCGSGRDNPCVIVYASGYNENAIIPFDPLTLALSPHWWTGEAMAAGVAAGTADRHATKLSNFVPLGSGYAGIEQGSERGHWFPIDGSTAIAIEPKLPKRYHPAYRGTRAIYGLSSTAEIVCANWLGDPQSGQANEMEVWRLDKSPVMALFTSNKPGDIALHHADIGNDYAAMTLIDNGGPASRQESVLIKVRMTDGQVTPIMTGLWRDTRQSRRFIDACRPTIAFTDDRIAYTLPVDGKTKLFLVEV